jgi:DNA transformation protein
MDRDDLIDLFAPFGPVAIKRLFSGFGISVDDVTFAIAVRGALYLKADSESVPRFEAEGSAPFQYEMNGKLRALGSYWQLPERLYDDPDELVVWARASLAVAQRAAMAKLAKARRPAKLAAPKPPKARPKKAKQA